MFFSKLPNIEYDKKPVSFPLSEQHYILAKNFFRRTSFIKNSFPNVVYFNKYTMTDEDRLDLLSQRFYGSPNYDWVILLTNNIINTNYDLPIVFVVEDNGVSTYTPTIETWKIKSEIPDDVIWYEYQKKWPHYGTGKWVVF